MQSILAIAFKDLKLLLRDRGGLFFTFFYPILFALFFGFIFTPSGDGVQAIKVDIIDQDQTPQSQAFAHVLLNAPELKGVLTDSLSARQDVRLGKRVAYILLKKGFGRASENPFMGHPPQVELAIDPSKKAEAGMLNGILMKYAVQNMQTFFSDTKRLKQTTRLSLKTLQQEKDMPQQEKKILTDLFRVLDRLWEDSALTKVQHSGQGFNGFQPLIINEKNLSFEAQREPNSFSVTFPQGIVWGLLACAISFAVSLVGERTRGTLFRIQAASVQKYALLGGKALASFIVSMVMAALLIVLGIGLFGVRVHSFAMLFVSLTVASLSFVGIMVLFSVLGKSERAVSGMSWALVLPLAMLGGGMVPLAFMPHWLQTISVISPVKWAILSIEGSLWRAFTWGQLAESLVILLLIGIFAFTIGVRRFSWE